ncbi:MAG: hypothetical protein WA373_06735 [Burkholderiales bacterium]
MKIAREDLKRLRLPAIIAAALIVLGAAAIVVSEHYLASAKTASAAARAQRIAAQDRMSKASEEEREIRASIVFYKKMQDQGMIGSENRLDWIESITRIKARRKLFEINYHIEAQKPLDYPGVTSSGATVFVVSRVKLDMTLLHEEDLLNFLSDLQNAGKSLVSVRRCSTARLDRGGLTASQTLLPRLRSECQIDLITLKVGKAA